MKNKPVGSKTKLLSAYNEFITQKLEAEPDVIKFARKDSTVDALCFKKLAHAFNLEIHHIKPKAIGGVDEIQNYVCLAEYDHAFAHWLFAIKDMIENGKFTMSHPFKKIPEAKAKEYPFFKKLRFLIKLNDGFCVKGNHCYSLTGREAVMFGIARSNVVQNYHECFFRLLSSAICKKNSLNLGVRLDIGEYVK